MSKSNILADNSDYYTLLRINENFQNNEDYFNENDEKEALLELQKIQQEDSNNHIIIDDEITNKKLIREIAVEKELNTNGKSIFEGDDLQKRPVNFFKDTVEVTKSIDELRDNIYEMRKEILNNIAVIDSLKLKQEQSNKMIGNALKFISFSEDKLKKRHVLIRKKSKKRDIKTELD